MHKTIASQMFSTQSLLTRIACHGAKGVQSIVLMTGFIFLAVVSTTTAAGFSGSLKEVKITDAQAINKPPAATFSYSINNNTVTFNASGSSDPDGTIVKYKWDFGDGSVSEGITVTHLYNLLSTSSVTLTVVDDKNGVSIAQKIIVNSVPKWIGETLGKSTWTLVYVDSQETTAADNAATNSFDNNPNTFWHTEWENNSLAPHEIQIDLNSTYDVDGLRYLPRQTGDNGRVCDYELYVSNDNNNWGEAVSKGTFESSFSQKEVAFASKYGRYVRFRAIHACYAGWTSMAEIDFHTN